MHMTIRPDEDGKKISKSAAFWASMIRKPGNKSKEGQRRLEEKKKREVINATNMN